MAGQSPGLLECSVSRSSVELPQSMKLCHPLLWLYCRSVMCTVMSFLSSGVDSPLHRAATALREAPGGYGGVVHFPEAI